MRENFKLKNIKSFLSATIWQVSEQLVKNLISWSKNALILNLPTRKPKKHSFSRRVMLRGAPTTFHIPPFSMNYSHWKWYEIKRERAKIRVHIVDFGGFLGENQKEWQEAAVGKKGAAGHKKFVFFLFFLSFLVSCRRQNTFIFFSWKSHWKGV